MFPVGFTYTCCLKILYMHIINALTYENLLILFHGLGHVCTIYMYSHVYAFWYRYSFLLVMRIWVIRHYATTN